MGNPIKDVWVVYDVSDPTNEFKAAFVDKEDAEGAVNILRSRGSPVILIDKVHLHHSEKDPEADESAHAPKSKSKKSKKKSTDLVTEGSGDELTRLGSDATEATPKPKKSKSPSKSETAAAVPKDIPGAPIDSLSGSKFFFAGTIPMGHKTAEATAKKHGAEIISNVTKADYVVLGKHAGEKQNEKIEQSKANKINEEEFIELIQIGVPNRLKRIAEDDAVNNGDHSAKRQKK